MDPGTIMAIMSALSAGIGSLTGDKAKTGSTYNKDQLSGLEGIMNDIQGMRGQGMNDITQNQNYNEGSDWLSSLFNDQDFFKNFEAPAMRNYEENTIPDLANRFASMGSGGSMGSTAFRNQANREGSNLQANLAAMRGGMQQQGVGQSLQYGQQPTSNFMQMFQQAMQPTQNTHTPANMGFMGGLAAPFAQGAANIWGQKAGQNAGQFPGTF